MKFIGHEDPFKITTKNYGEVEIPKETLKFPQVESVEEAVEFFGGPEKLVDGLNDLLYSRAKNGALALVRNASKADGATIEDAFKRAVDYAEKYNPSIERVSKQQLLEGVDILRSKKEELAAMSHEEIVKLLEQTLKI